MGRAIAAALGIQGSGRSAIQGQGVIVTWCLGHLVEALAPEGYDPALKQWRLEPLPFFPEAFRYAPIEATKDQYQTVAGLMTRADVDEIVNATDAGREGELIFDLVYRLAGADKPVLRFWTSSLTDEAIREAYGRMKPGESYKGLRDAARCRQEADWLVGINCTRAQTLAQRRAGGEGVYSVGRVQTPTLALMVNRELEIQNFVPKDFWTLWAQFQAAAGGYRGKWFRKEGDRFDTEAEAVAMAEALAGKPGKVASVSARTEKKKPELLYDLTALQKEANKRFGFTAEHTLEVAQGLYEGKLISYPRTNSRCLTEADALKIPGWIKAIGQGQLAALQPFVDDLRKRWPVRLDKRFVNDKEVEDHTALVPTESPARTLQGDPLRIYELIARRFLAAHWPDRIEAKTTIITRIDKETFKTTGTVVKALGWSEVDPPHGRPRKAKETEPEETEAEPDEDSGTLPVVAKDERVETADLAAQGRQDHPAQAHVRGGPAGGDAERGQGAGRRGAEGGDEGLRPGHPRHPRQHHRDPAQAQLRGAQAQHPAAHRQGHRTGAGHPGRGAQEPPAHRGVGGPDGAHPPGRGRARRLHGGHPALRPGAGGADQGLGAPGGGAGIGSGGGALSAVRGRSASEGMGGPALPEVLGPGCRSRVPGGLRHRPRGKAAGTVPAVPGPCAHHPERGEGLRAVRQMGGRPGP